MAECESMGTCPFFNDKMSIDEGVGVLYKQRYCKTNKEGCARYIVRQALGKDRVPADLYPNMAERARDIVNKS